MTELEHFLGHLGYTSTKYTSTDTMISNRKICLLQAAIVCSDTQDSFTLPTSSAIRVLKTTTEKWLFSHETFQNLSPYFPQDSVILKKKSNF